MKNIVVVSASNNNNLKLAQEFEKYLSSQGSKVEVVNLVDVDLPLYSPKLDSDESRPQGLDKYVDLMTNCDGAVFVAPEYNGSIPPNLNNFVAWLSRCGKEDWRSCFNGKPAVIATHSGGGGAHVLIAMRQQFSYVGMNVLGRQIQTNYQKPLNQDSLKATCDELLKLS